MAGEQGNFPTFKKFVDDPESDFYAAAGRTPEQTWDEVHGCFIRAINDVRENIARGKPPLIPEAIAHWQTCAASSASCNSVGVFRRSRATKDPFQNEGQWGGAGACSC